jgi:hypothetical protein
MNVLAQEMARRLAYQTAAVDFAAKADDFARAALRLHRAAEGMADDALVNGLAEHAQDVLAGVCAVSPGIRAVFAAAVGSTQPESAEMAPEQD